MNALLKLKDIHQPPSISQWPPALGWWLLAGMIVVVLSLGFYFFYTHWKKFYVKRVALKQLEKLISEYRRKGGSMSSEVREQQRCNLKAKGYNPRFVAALSALLKQVCLAYHPQKEIAGLYGKRWLERLDRLAGEPVFGSRFGQFLISGPYQSDLSADLIPLFFAAKIWLHRIQHRGVHRV